MHSPQSLERSDDPESKSLDQVLEEAKRILGLSESEEGVDISESEDHKALTSAVRAQLMSAGEIDTEDATHVEKLLMEVDRFLIKNPQSSFNK